MEYKLHNYVSEIEKRVLLKMCFIRLRGNDLRRENPAPCVYLKVRFACVRPL